MDSEGETCSSPVRWSQYSYIDIYLITRAIENQVIILKLPPHSSHLLQPLNLSVFKAYKDIYDLLLVKWQRQNISQNVPNKVFVELMSVAWEKVTESTVAAGFRKGGIYQFNNKVIPERTFNPEALERYKRQFSTSKLSIVSSGTVSHTVTPPESPNIRSNTSTTRPEANFTPTSTSTPAFFVSACTAAESSSDATSIPSTSASTLTTI